MTKMKLTISSALLLSLFLLQSCKDTSEAKGEDATVNTDSVNNALMNEVKAEPKVKEAVLTNANVLYVAVEDNGSPRDGYASYFCETIKEHKADVKMVKVVEYGTMESPEADNAYGKLLGQSICN